MKYQIPKTTFAGKPVAGSLERVLERLNPNPNNPQTPPQTPPIVNALNLSGYIFVPLINLYVAKQRTHNGLNWNQTHETLHSEGLKMPTIPQFLEYLKFLQNGYQDRNEAQVILDDILKLGNWRGEWLDAKFLDVQGNLTISYNHTIDKSGNLKPKNNRDLLLRDYLKTVDPDTLKILYKDLERDFLKLSESLNTLHEDKEIMIDKEEFAKAEKKGNVLKKIKKGERDRKVFVKLGM